MKEELLKIINHYGINNQLKYIHSEYFELDEAIIDWWNEELFSDKVTETEHKDHIAGEIADIMVMLKQFQYLYKIEDKQVEDIMKYKIKRQLERIDKEC